jgi:hypothetical protein
MNNVPLMFLSSSYRAATSPAAHPNDQKSFGSLLQKRTFFLPIAQKTRALATIVANSPKISTGWATQIKAAMLMMPTHEARGRRRRCIDPPAVCNFRLWMTKAAAQPRI